MGRLTIIIILILSTIFIFGGCSSNVSSSTPSGGSSDWLVPVDQVFDGGPGRDGIPSIDNPRFATASEIRYLDDDDLVIGINVGDEVRAYPHPILDWHEIINDQIGGTSYAVTYCPLTGTAIGWNREVNGQTTTFGVSGLLYNTNLMPYDRATGSTWSQMSLLCVNGTLKGTTPELVPLLETTWKTWMEMYPESKVVSENTGFSRPYGIYPYGDYRTNNVRLIFPISNDDSRLPRKNRVLGLIAGDNTKIYQISEFPENIGVLNEIFNGIEIVVAGSRGKNFVVAYESTLDDGTKLTFNAIQNSLPSVIIDDEGTSWDIFGNGIEGPRAGEKLKATKSYLAYWFAWGTFYPGAGI
jgi:Protein of unknown function (DUF3179)